MLFEDVFDLDIDDEYDFSDGWLVPDHSKTTTTNKRKRSEPDALEIADCVIQYKKYFKLVKKYKPDVLKNKNKK